MGWFELFRDFVSLSFHLWWGVKGPLWLCGLWFFPLDEEFLIFLIILFFLEFFFVPSVSLLSPSHFRTALFLKVNGERTRDARIFTFLAIFRTVDFTSRPKAYHL